MTLQEISDRLDYAENLLRDQPNPTEELLRYSHELMVAAGFVTGIHVPPLDEIEEVNWRRDGF